MSELKVHRFITTDELFPEANAGALYYDKSEADNVIAELKKACKDKDDWCLHLIKELHHHKYKRCLTMVKVCKLKRYDAADYRIPRRKWDFYDKWLKRWLELAEKFKEDIK